MKFDLRFKIDTMQLKTRIENIEDLSVFDSDFITWAKRTDRTSDDVIVFKIHLSEYIGTCDGKHYTYAEQMEIKNKMLKELGVLNLFEVKEDRLDLCFDTTVEFEEMFKRSDCFKHLYAMNYKTTNTFDNLNTTCFEVENMKVLSRYNELEIYNKKKQRKGQYPYNTRVEFRFKNIKVDEKTKIKDLVKLLDRMIENYEAFEEQRAEALYNKYLKDLEKGKVKNFTQFVNANKDYVTSTKVCKALYERTMMKKGYKDWLRKYSETNDIDFLTKTEMKQMVADMKKAIKTYMKA